MTASAYLTIQEVAVIERIHRITAYKRAQAGEIPGAMKIGSAWRIDTALYAKRRNLTLDQIKEALAS